jgi:hypothetical protein
LYINKRILSAIQQYDKKLYILWNNEVKHFEVWRKMPWGDRLITPVTHNIYEPGTDQNFEPLDQRILAWLESADSYKTRRSMAWKWRRDRRFKSIHENKQKKFNNKLKNAALDNYYLVNNDLMSLSIDKNESDWERPNIQSNSRSRVMYRDRYYEYDSNRSN